jgi:hypothetical protein
MNYEQPAARQERVRTAEHALAHAKPRGEAVGTAGSREQQVKRSPLPSAREIEAAVARKYGCEPFRETGNQS